MRGAFPRRTSLLALLPLLPLLLKAQDERVVKSPDGRVEFRIFVAQPNDGDLAQLAYQIWFNGSEVLTTSWMGLDIHNQQPLLGQNLGLIHSSMGSGGSSPEKYNTLTAEYMQNGSLGRRLNVEVRTYDSGVAFRYVIPKSAPLNEILIQQEGTVFSFVRDAELAKAGAEARFDLPFITTQPDAGRVAIAEAGEQNFPRAYLAHVEGGSLIARLPPRAEDPNLAFAGTTPLTLPWYMVIFGLDKDRLPQSPIFRDLAH
jgi:alpha-glucosidase